MSALLHVDNISKRFGGFVALDGIDLEVQPGERLGHVDQAHVAHHPGPETRVQQVQDRVLDAADVLVHRHPVVVARVDHRRLAVDLCVCLLYTSPSPRDRTRSRMPSSA